MRPFMKLLLVATFVLSSASPALAQAFRISAVQAWPDHPLLGSPRGVDVGVEAEVSSGVGLRANFELAGDDFQSTGSTCVGITPPELDCSPELRDERGRTRSLMLSVPLTVHSVKAARFNLVPAVRAAWLESDQVGTESGRTRGATKTMYGFELGAETIFPLSRLPLALFVSGHFGAIQPARDERMVDGYSPFEESVQTRRIQLGVVISR